ncbi:MAG: diacylglycerol kinase family lipid kinase [Flavipsychrobacter sp.]
MNKKHLVFIINPNSGVDRQKAIQNAIDDHLNLTQFSYEIQHTQYAKHGIELSRAAAQKGAYAVVAVGGDGSVNDVVAGLSGTDTCLAIIPKGSGNGMARSMGIPLDVVKAIEVINSGNVIKMDIGYANDQRFISNAGVAFDAIISKEFASSKRRGFLIYSWLVTRNLFSYKEKEWQITFDGNTINKKAFMVNVANGKQFGYNFQIAPDASWTDGLFDIIIIRKFPKLLGGMLVLRAMNGTITKSKYVEHYRAKEISIHHPDLKLMQTDGDAHDCANTIKFTITKGEQKILVP